MGTGRLRVEFLWFSIVFCTIRRCLKIVLANYCRPSFALIFALSISSGVEEFTNPTRPQHLMALDPTANATLSNGSLSVGSFPKGSSSEGLSSEGSFSSYTVYTITSYLEINNKGVEGCTTMSSLTA